MSNDSHILVSRKALCNLEEHVIPNGSMKFNMKFHMENHQELSQCFPYVGWMEEFVVLNFIRCVFLSFLICTKNDVCVFPSFVGIMPRATFYPQYYEKLDHTPTYHPKLICNVWGLTFIFFPFPRSPLPNLKLSILRMISILLHNCECLAHPHMVDVNPEDGKKNKIT